MSNSNQAIQITDSEILLKNILDHFTGEALHRTRDALRDLEGAALEVLEKDPDRAQLANNTAYIHSLCHQVDKLCDRHQA